MILHKIRIWFILLLAFSHCGQLSLSHKKGVSSTQLLILAEILASSTCQLSGEFWARDLSSNTSYCLSAHLAAQTGGVDVWVQDGLNTVLDYQDIANTTQDQILPNLSHSFGKPEDINHDNKTAILLLDIRDSSSGGDFVAGYFDPADFFTDSYRNQIRSNERDMIYIDAVQLVQLRNEELAVGWPDGLKGTIAHEFQHLIRYQYELPSILAGGQRDATWINEGSSELASDIAGFGPQWGRIQCYKGTSSSGCPSANGRTVYGSPEFQSLEDYSFAYAMALYLYSVSGNSDSERNYYEKNTIEGDANGIRANNTENMIRVFQSSSLQYSRTSGYLGTNTKEIFGALLASFTWQSAGLGSSNPQKTLSGNSDVTSTFEQILSLYAFPDSGMGKNLKYLYTDQYNGTSDPFSTLSSNISLSPGQIQYVDGTLSSNSSSTFIFLMDTNSTFLQINGNTDDSSSSTGVSAKVSPSPDGFYGSNQSFCPMHWISERHSNLIRKDLNRYKSRVLLSGQTGDYNIRVRGSAL